MLSQEVQDILQRQTCLKFDEKKMKVLCQYTKHEMPPTVAAIQSYLQGKRFRNASKRAFDFDQFRPHIVPSTKKNHFHELFCFLTLRHVAKTPEAVKRHVDGKRYKCALAKWTKCQEIGEKFIPRGRRSQHGKGRDSDSDSIASGGMGRHWSDDSEEDAGTEDDMDDLYPPEMFGAADAGTDEETDEDDDDIDTKEKDEKLPSPPRKKSQKKNNSGKKEKADEDSDSDYDLSVLDSGTKTNDDVAQNIPTLERKEKRQKKANKGKGKEVKNTSDNCNGINGAKHNGEAAKRTGSLDSDPLKSKKKKKNKTINT